MEEYDIADNLEEYKEPRNSSSEEDESTKKGEDESTRKEGDESNKTFTKPWIEKLKAMKKLKENMKKKETRKKPSLYDKEQVFRKLCADKSIPYLEENKSKIDHLLSSCMLILQTYILASITIVNMVITNIIDNELVHETISWFMERGLLYRHYYIRLNKSHDLDEKLKRLGEPYQSIKLPNSNDKFNILFEKVLDKYISDLSAKQ